MDFFGRSDRVQIGVMKKMKGLKFIVQVALDCNDGILGRRLDICYEEQTIIAYIDLAHQ